MRTLIAAAALAVTAPAPAQEPGEIWNGKDLSGWTFFLEKSGPNASGTMLMGDVWKVDGGTIRCSGAPNGYIRTVADYGDFVLRLEWRWPGKPGDGGVLLRVVGADKIWPRSIEAQLLSGSAGDIWLMDGAALTTPPAHSDPVAANHRPRLTTAERPVGEWNLLEATVRGDQVVLKINGVVVNQGTGAEELAGKIALQSQGTPIEFRNIQLTPITE